MTSVAPSRAATGNSTRSQRKAGLVVGPHDLTWALMDNVLERIEAARDCDIQDRGVETRRLLDSAAMIIGELRAALDLHQGGAIAANVDELYDYMCRRLKVAGLRNGTAALEEVSHLLYALRSAWAFMPAEMRAASRN
jgi:flagellar secretion chaperone FliS